MSSAEVSSSSGEKSTNEILGNKTDAQDARDEYKKLQAQRKEE